MAYQNENYQPFSLKKKKKKKKERERIRKFVD